MSYSHLSIERRTNLHHQLDHYISASRRSRGQLYARPNNNNNSNNNEKGSICVARLKCCVCRARLTSGAASVLDCAVAQVATWTAAVRASASMVDGLPVRLKVYLVRVLIGCELVRSSERACYELYLSAHLPVRYIGV